MSNTAQSQVTAIESKSKCAIKILTRSPGTNQEEAYGPTGEIVGKGNGYAYPAISGHQTLLTTTKVVSPRVWHNGAGCMSGGNSRSLASRTLSFLFHLATLTHLQIPPELEEKFPMKGIWTVQLFYVWKTKIPRIVLVYV